MKEYVVVANDEPSIDQLHLELINDTSNDNSINDEIIPNRPVTVANPRLLNPRITHYFLTDNEAIALSKDPRVTCINPVPTNDLIKNFTIEPKFLKKSQKSQSFDGHLGNFNRIFEPNNTIYNINWGLRRTSLKTAERKPGNTYDYDIDGSGVDVVIVDDGLEFDHPEFNNTENVCRIHQIDWYQMTGLPGKMPVNHYSTTGLFQAQHGTHVGAIAAGKTFGYAKNSRIYSLRVVGRDDQIIDISDIFDLIRLWHSKKPIEKITGSRRPTVVNMSWGFFTEYPIKIDSIFFRNRKITYKDPISRQGNFGQVFDRHGFRIPSVDVEAQMCEDAGVIFVRAAGNFSHKIDKIGGVDYENYYTNKEVVADYFQPGDKIYYHRGSSPMTKNIINVGSSSNTNILSGGILKERLDSFSDRGPGCDVIAPGNSITSASSKNSGYGFNQYVWGTVNQKVFNSVALSGTSQASPQVAGVIALYLTRYPAATPENVKKWIQTTGIKNQLLSSELNNDWGNPRSLLGGPNNYLFNPFRKGYRD